MKFDVILYGLADGMAAAQLQMSVQMIKGVDYCLCNHNASRMTVECADDQYAIVQPQIVAAIKQTCPNVDPKF